MLLPAKMQHRDQNWPLFLTAARNLTIAGTRASTSARARPSGPVLEDPRRQCRRGDSKDHTRQYRRRPGVIISGRACSSRV
jgi:hypothetical protein